jgi:tetratricopeptide (TPR) repeat protein
LLVHQPGAETGAATGCDLRYRAFISYSHADARWAAWLHRRLEGYRLPSRLRGGTGEHGPLPDRLSPIFRDREDLSSAGHLGPQIQAALAHSEALVVVCSPDAARSPWVDSEIRAFKRLGRGDRIYAFIVDGEPNAGDARECFPEALRFDLSADGDTLGGEANPVAADARAGKDGKSLALLKLLAGLFGLPLDTLRQREAQRYHRRMAAITGLAVLVMLVTSVLAVQAVVARKAAERRQKQAEALVDFMLGDLNDKLSQVGRLDILAKVNDKAMDYFASLPTTDVTQEALEQRSKALVKIGVVRAEQGDNAGAMKSYRAASALSGPLARAAPADVARQLAHADVLSYIALVHWDQGDLANAGRGFDDAARVLAAARRHAPADAQLLYQALTNENNNGHVLESRGRFKDATEHYERMLGLARQLAERDPGNIERHYMLGLAHNNLAKMALLRGDLQAAITGYRAEVAIQRRLAAQDPRNNAQRRNLLIAAFTLGRTLVLAGEADAGHVLMREALDTARALHAMEPASTDYRDDIGLYALQLASVERKRGNLQSAARLLRESLAMLEHLVTTNPTHPAWQRERAEALVERAALAAAGHSGVEDAAADLKEALAILEPQRAQHPQDRAIVLATANAQLGLAAISSAPHRASLAARALSSIDAQSTARDDPRLVVLRDQAMRLLARDGGLQAPSTMRSTVATH